MGRKIGVTPSEMMELRNQGYSNHDIAKMLDVSLATVCRYIGKQGGRMTRMKAFANCPKPDAPEPVRVERYKPKALYESFRVGDRVDVAFDAVMDCITLEAGDGAVSITREEANELVQLLVWAAQREMEEQG